MSRRVFTIILDGLGVGDLPDSADYGDSGCNTLAHVAEAAGGISLPALESLGLGLVQPFRGMDPGRAVRAAHARMAEKGLGKDSTTGHWELAGVVLDRAFPVYPHGFPEDLLALIRERSGYDFIGNEPASGTEIIERLGDEHLRSGHLIVYTSADSVLQVAAHEELIPLDELYAFCLLVRELMTGEHAVSRVIARPFLGESGAFVRTANRRDFSLTPPGDTLLDRLLASGLPVVGVGKVKDLFAGRGFSRHVISKSNAQGMGAFTELLDAGEAPGYHLVNLVDFDMLWGHRRDPAGYAEGLLVFDDWLGGFLRGMGEDDLLFITADHGNDPCAPGSDHTREYVPLLVHAPGMTRSLDLGVRDSFADYAATVAEIFGLSPGPEGRSFLGELEDIE